MEFTSAWSALAPDWLRRRYAAKLTVALLVVVTLTVGFGVVVQAQTDAQLQGDVRDDLTTAAAERATTLDTWLSGVKSQTVLTSRHPAIASGDRETVKDHLDGLQESGVLPSGVAAVHYYDTADKEIVTSTAEPLIGVSPAEQGAPFAENPPTFSGPDDTYVTKPFEVPVVDHPVVAVVSPVPGVENRAIVYMLDIERQAAALTGASDTQTLVGGGDDRFVAHPDAERIATPVEDVAALVGASGVVERDGQVMATASLSAADWTVVTRTPATQAYALGDSVASSILGLILLTVVGLAVVGVTVGSNTVISLRRIAGRADAMAAGELDEPMQSRREDELGTVVDSFESMRRSL